MPCSSSPPTPTIPVQTERALATVEAFLQASGCPEHNKNAWLYLKKAIQALSTTQNPSATSAHNEILKRLSAIEKRLSTSPAMLPKPSTYTDLARLARPILPMKKLSPAVLSRR
jgi:hypothetical protein